MTDLVRLTFALRENRDLDINEAAEAADLLASLSAADADREFFLLALADKGETAVEVAGFARTFRKLARNPRVEEWAYRAIDVCGTGGDKTGTFNISTTVAFILAAGDVPVFKHGNRSITSKCGSADLLAALGVPLDADDELLRESLRELNFAFFFAPAFHPAFKAIMPVRQTLAKQGRRTIFNILGPLINPGRPSRQMLGVFDERCMPIMAAALESLEVENGLVVHCRLNDGRGMDELSSAGSNRVIGFGRSRGRAEEWLPERFGLRTSSIEELAGGALEENLALLHRALSAQAPRGLLETIYLNAGTAFQVAGRTETVEDGISLARELIESGAVKERVERISAFFKR